MSEEEGKDDMWFGYLDDKFIVIKNGIGVYAKTKDDAINLFIDKNKMAINPIYNRNKNK